MSVNSFFEQGTCAGEQALIEDLTIESIKQYGVSMRYLPKTAVRTDYLFGEDILKQFNDAVEIEMYIKNVEGFEGEGDFLSKFNLQIADQVTFTVARKRFDQAKSEKILGEDGYNLLQEDDPGGPSRRFLSTPYEGFSFELETATSEGYSITTNRPTEGDLIYFPLVDKIFEIKFVEHEPVFYQMGRLQAYDIRCELFVYSHEEFATGNTVIDVIADNNTADVLAFEFTLEDDSGVILGEDGDSLLQEYNLENQLVSNNNYFSSNDPAVLNTDIIDFSETNPFVDRSRY